VMAEASDKVAFWPWERKEPKTAPATEEVVVFAPGSRSRAIHLYQQLQDGTLTNAQYAHIMAMDALLVEEQEFGNIDTARAHRVLSSAEIYRQEATPQNSSIPPTPHSQWLMELGKRNQLLGQYDLELDTLQQQLEKLESQEGRIRAHSERARGSSLTSISSMNSSLPPSPRNVSIPPSPVHSRSQRSDSSSATSFATAASMSPISQARENTRSVTASQRTIRREAEMRRLAEASILDSAGCIDTNPNSPIDAALIRSHQHREEELHRLEHELQIQSKPHSPEVTPADDNSAITVEPVSEFPNK